MTNSKESIAIFTDWLNKNGASLPSLAFNPSINGLEGRGNGLFTTAPLALEHEKVMATVPQTLLLNASRVLQIARSGKNEGAKRLKKCLEGLQKMDDGSSAWERLCLLAFLICARIRLHECAAGEDSDLNEVEFWLPYIEILPAAESLNTPVFWDEDAITLLQGTGLDMAARAKQNKLENEFMRLVPHLAHLCMSEIELGVESLLWADGIFWSRVLSLASANPAVTDDYHLIPLVDFCNHSFTPHIRWHIEESTGQVELRAIATTESMMPADTELFISYGGKPNPELLFIHGFVLPNNPFDKIQIPVPFVEQGIVEEDEESTDSEEDSEGEGELLTEPRPSRSEARKRMEDKAAFLAAIGLKSVVGIRAPMEDNQGQNYENDPTKGILTRDDLLTMYVAVLTAEDGFGCQHSSEATFTVGGCSIDPLDKVTFADFVESLPHFEIIRLRVWHMLLEAVHHRLVELGGVESGTETLLAGEGEETPEELRIARVDILREGIYDLLVAAYGLLEELQEQWAEIPVVQEYLASHNDESD